jgi:hypothetical protein
MYNTLKIIKTFLYSYSALHVSGNLAPIIRSLLILHIQPPVTLCRWVGCIFQLWTVTVEQFPDINRLCNVASCWIYSYIGIRLGPHPILHISTIRVKVTHKPSKSVNYATTKFAAYGVAWFSFKRQFHWVSSNNE